MLKVINSEDMAAPVMVPTFDTLPVGSVFVCFMGDGKSPSFSYPDTYLKISKNNMHNAFDLKNMRGVCIKNNKIVKEVESAILTIKK